MLLQQSALTDLNESDEWGYNQSDALSQHRRQLVTERLSCSSGHAHKHIPVTYTETDASHRPARLYSLFHNNNCENSK